MATIQIGDEIHATKLDLKDMIEDVKEQKAVIIPCNYTFNNVPADFQLAINIYRFNFSNDFLFDFFVMFFNFENVTPNLALQLIEANEKSVRRSMD